MFKWRKSRIAPQVDDYIRRRYEDLAVCIAKDIANNRGLFCYYTPWLDHMMGKFNLPQDYRVRHSLVVTDSEGKHIGCSGAVSNTLVYYNPIPESNKESQFQEAVSKSLLSERFKGHGRSREGQEGKDNPLETVAPSDIQESIPSEMAGGDKVDKVTNVDGRITVSSGIQKDLCNAVKPKATPTEGNETHTATSNVWQNQSTDCLSPRYITEDGVVHVVNELRPQSTDSYYARIDEAFRKHRADKPALGVTERNSESGVSEDRTPQLPTELERKATSRFCTIL